MNARIAYTVMKNHAAITRGYWQIQHDGRYKGFIVVYGPSNFKIDYCKYYENENTGVWRIVPNQTTYGFSPHVNPATAIPVESTPDFNTDSWNFVFQTDFGGSWTNVYNWMKTNSGRIKNLTGHGTWRWNGEEGRWVPYNGRMLNLDSGKEVEYGIKLTNAGIPLEWIVSNLAATIPAQTGPSPIERLHTRVRGFKRFLAPTENGLDCYEITKQYVRKRFAYERLGYDQIETLLNAPVLYVQSGSAPNYTKC